MSEQIIPDRQHELADKSYRMLEYTWFRVIGRVGELAYPHYLGRGIALDPRYNIRDVWQEPMPEHVVVKISLSEGGSISSGDPGQSRPVKPGEAILRFVEDPDIWEGYNASHRGQWQFLGLILAGPLAARAARGLIGSFGRIYPLGVAHPIVRQLSQIVTEPDHVAEMPMSRAFRLCNDVIQALLDTAEAAIARSGQRLDQAEVVDRLMRQDLGRDWSVEELARHCRVTREHLTRVFTRRYGLPPHRYLMQVRMQEACRRLRTTDEMVKTIAYSLGFTSHASFVRTFQRFNDMTPSEYRERGVVDR